jgi:hypothetical protein
MIAQSPYLSRRKRKKERQKPLLFQKRSDLRKIFRIIKGGKKNMVYEGISVAGLSFNQTDTVVLVVLAAFILLGLIFGAKELAAHIVCDAISTLLGLFLANIVLKVIEPMDFYQKIIATLWNNATLVNWIAYILLSSLIGGLLYWILKLIFKALIKGTKDAPLLNRLLGVILGIADWAILLISVTFLLTLIPTWLGNNTPSWVQESNTYLSSSLIVGKMMEYFRSLLSLLGLV